MPLLHDTRGARRPPAGAAAAEAPRPGPPLLALCVSALIVIPLGAAVFRSLRDTGPELRCSPAVDRVELVEEDAGLDIATLGQNVGTVLRRSVIDELAEAKRLERRNSMLRRRAAGLERRAAALERHGRVAARAPITGQTPGRRGVGQQHNRRRAQVPGEIRLSSQDSKSSLVVRFAQSGRRPLDAEACWDASHQRIAAWLRFDTCVLVGEVDPPSGRFTSRGRIQRPIGADERAPQLFWRGDRVVICCQAQDDSRGLINCVLEVDLPSGRSRTVFAEEQWDPSRGAIRCALLSPDGRWLAFDRSREPSNLAKGGTCAGIWLLDLQSGECQEITHESEPDYHHRLVGWDGSDVLFLRRVGRERARPDGIGYQYDLYRARIGVGLRSRGAPDA